MTAVSDGQVVAAVLCYLDENSRPNLLFGAPAISTALLERNLSVGCGTIPPDQVIRAINPLCDSLFPIPRKAVQRTLTRNGEVEEWVVFKADPERLPKKRAGDEEGTGGAGDGGRIAARVERAGEDGHSRSRTETAVGGRIVTIPKEASLQRAKSADTLSAIAVAGQLEALPPLPQLTSLTRTKSAGNGPLYLSPAMLSQLAEPVPRSQISPRPSEKRSEDKGKEERAGTNKRPGLLRALSLSRKTTAKMASRSAVAAEQHAQGGIGTEVLPRPEPGSRSDVQAHQDNSAGRPEKSSSAMNPLRTVKVKPPPLPPIPPRRMTDRSPPSAPLPPLTLRLDPTLPGGEYEPIPRTAVFRGETENGRKRGFFRRMLGNTRDKASEGIPSEMELAGNESGGTRNRPEPPLPLVVTVEEAPPSGVAEGLGEVVQSETDTASKETLDKAIGQPIGNAPSGHAMKGSKVSAADAIFDEVLNELLSDLTSGPAAQDGWRAPSNAIALCQNDDLVTAGERPDEHDNRTFLVPSASPRPSGPSGPPQGMSAANEADCEAQATEANEADGKDVASEMTEAEDDETVNDSESRSGDESDGRSTTWDDEEDDASSVLTPVSSQAPLTYVDQIFEGLPFGPDVPAFQIIDWARTRWKVLGAELVVVLGLAYVVQASGY